MDLENGHYTALVDGLKRLLDNNEHSDITVEVGNKTFSCHKAVLAAMSPYFDAMFSSGMRETISGHVTFPDMEVDLFENVLNYIYTGKVDLTIENAVELLHISAVLQIKPLQKLCEDFLYPHLSSENCLKVWRLSVAHDCKILSSKALDMVAAHFREVIKTEEFWEIDGKELAAIIDSDLIDLKPEDAICDIVIKWIKKDEANRVSSAGLLFENVRLPFLRPEYLVTLEEENSFLRNDEKCVKVLNDAKNYSLLPARKQEIYSKQTRHRANFGWEEVVVVVGGCETALPPYIRSLEVICYSFTNRKWFELCPLPYDPGIEFAACSYKNDIYISGGGCMQKCLLRYDSDKDLWAQLTTMKEGRRRHALQATTGFLYAIGGYDNKLEEGSRMNKTIEMYSISDGTWELVGELAVPVSSFSSALIGDCIYIFGGEKNDKKDTAVVQCYDTRHKQSYKLDTKIPLACKLTKSVVCNNRVFLIFFDGRVTEFVKDKNEKTKAVCRTVGKLTSFQRIHFGVVHYQGCILVVGGECDSNTLCNDLIMFDPNTTGCKKLEDTLPAARLIDGCVKISAQKKYMKALNA